MSPDAPRPRDQFLQRLDAVEQRLQQHAQTGAADGLTDPDPPTGERWEWGQVWAHLAEFLPYWLAQAQELIGAYQGEPVPFGRTKSDPDRVAAIARDRNQKVARLWERARDGIGETRTFLRQLPDGAWAVRGLHSTLGVMQLAAIVDEFMVGHLEQHADQLDGLARG
jgi:alpha-L-fucosidase